MRGDEPLRYSRTLETGVSHMRGDEPSVAVCIAHYDVFPTCVGMNRTYLAQRSTIVFPTCVGMNRY